MWSIIHWTVFAVVNLAIIGMGVYAFFWLRTKIRSKQDPKWAADLIEAVQAELASFQAEKVSWPKRIESLESKYNTLSGRISRVQTQDEERSPEAAMREMMQRFQLMQQLANQQRQQYSESPAPEPTLPRDPYFPNGVRSSLSEDS